MKLNQMNQMMKQAKALQDKLKQQLDEIRVEATSGGGMVTVKMRGNKTVTEVRIDPEVVDKNEVEMLQDLITAAVNEASRKVDDAAQREIGSLAGNLPGLF
jgi:DNA-binding YbaB/EbfC family protein